MRGSLLIVLILAAGLHPEWQTGPAMPSARDHLGCGTVEGMLVVAGGACWKDGSKHYASDTIAYSPRNGKWIRLPFVPVAGAYGASAVIGGQLLIAGGANDHGALGDCFRLVKTQGRFVWKRLPDLPTPLAGAQGAEIGGDFYAFGGAPAMDEAGIRSSRPSLLVLDADGWKERPVPRELGGRVGSALAAIGERLFIFGGYGVQSDGTLGNYADAWTYRKGAWHRLRDIPIPSRWTAALALDDRHIGLFGGYGEGFLDNTFVYDTERDAYVPGDSLPLPVATMSAGLDGRTIYLAGGEDAQRHRTGALFIGKLDMP